MVRIGVIGLGVGKFHIRKIVESKEGILSAICDIDEKKLNEVGDIYNIPQNRRFTDYKDLINCEDVDAVEVCTPNYLHAKMAVEVIRANKPVQVEKPLDVNYEEAVKIREALQKNPVTNMTVFSYRFFPATRYAKELMEKGIIGDIVNVRIEYLKDSGFWKGRRLDWRFIKKYSGAGVIADLGAHLLDMAEFLVGKINKVFGTVKTVVKERMELNSDNFAKVETDDSAQGILNFECGATGVFNISRCAHGHDNHILFEVYGTKGVIAFDLNNSDVLKLRVVDEVENSWFNVNKKDIANFDIAGKDGGKMVEVKVPEEYYLSQEQAFIRAVEGRAEKYHPDIDQGLRCQKIIDAVLESDKTGAWVDIS